MTDEIKKQKAFFSALFEKADAVGVSFLPVKGAQSKADERVLPFPDFLRALSVPYDKTAHFPCFTPNPQTLGERRSNKNTKTLNAIFVDIDGASLPPIAAHAHFVLARDASHFHLYFLVARLDATEANRDRVRELTKRLIHLCAGDKSVHDPARVLRVPFTPHVKGGVESPGYSIHTERNAPRYTLDELEKLIGDATAKPSEHSENRERYVVEMYERKNRMSIGEGRSRTLFFVGLDCHGWGIDEGRALEIAAHLNKKICTPPETDAVVSHQIKSAYKYRKAPFGSYTTAQDSKEQRKQREQFEEVSRVRDIMQNHVYVIGAEMLIDRESREQYTTDKQQNFYIAHKCATSLQLPVLLREHAVYVCDRLDFRPDIDEDIYTVNGLTFYNRFRPFPVGEPSGNKKPARLFCEHLRFLAGGDYEFDTLLKFFAFICQNPGRKLAWAPLIVSQNHGVGKSILETLFRSMFGREYVTAVGGHELAQPQTDYLTDKLVVIGEELELNDKNVMPKIRDHITRDSFRNIAKYQRSYDVTNVANFMFFSNRIDAIRIDRFDRRLFVIFNRAEPKPGAYYAELAKAFTENAADIFAFLQSVDLSNFNPNDRPELTEGKTLLIEQSKSELEMFLDEELENHSGPFADGVVSVKSILDHASNYAPESVKRFMTQRSVSFYLTQNSFRQYRVDAVEDNEHVRRRVWFRGDAAQFNAAQGKAKKPGKSMIEKLAKD